MTRVLFISYAFPPSPDAESRITYNYVRKLEGMGVGLGVVTGNPAVRSIDTRPVDISFDATIYRAASMEDRIIGIFIKSGYTRMGKTIALPPQGSSGARRKPMLTELLGRAKLLPNHVTGWIAPATRAAKVALRNESYDCIISRSNPITSHLAALSIKKRCQLPWIACFSDPWSIDPTSPYSGRYWSPEFVKQLSDRLEEKVISHADKIVLTTRDQQELYSHKYSEHCSKFINIPNSYNPEDELGHGPRACQQKKRDRFTIVHTGYLARERSPEPVFRALAIIRNRNAALLANLRLQLIGKSSDFDDLIRTYDLFDIVESIGPVSKSEAIEFACNADLLLLIDAPSRNRSMFMPSKLTDYIRTGIPILAVTPPGVSSDIVSTTKTGTVISPYDPEGIADAILSMYTDFVDGGRSEFNPDWQEIEKYCIDRCARDLIEAIESLARHS